MKKGVLTIFTGAFLDSENLVTVNRSFNEIIKEYASGWDKVHLICPVKGDKEIIKVSSRISDRIYVTGVKYEKKLNERLSLFAGGYKKTIKKYLGDTGIIEETDWFHFRFPNYFVLMLAYGLSNKKLNTCFYIAGNELELIKLNYAYLYPFALLKNALERKVMKNRPIVSTGVSLALEYKSISPTHAYFSTSHTEVVKRNPKEHFNHCLYVGSIYESKRAIDLVKAIFILKDDYPDIKCTVLGDGSSFEELKQYVRSKGLEGEISLPGYIYDREKIKGYYRQADFLILPSLSEGTPRVLPEAMSHGVIPLAVKDVGGNNHIITHKKNGSLVKPKSPESIAFELKEYLEDKTLYKESLEGIFKYAEKHTLTKEVDKLWDFVLKHPDLS